jgi:hypothetical protein
MMSVRRINHDPPVAFAHGLTYRWFWVQRPALENATVQSRAAAE